MIFMYMNQDATIHIRNKYLHQLLLNIWKKLKIFTLCNQFFSFTKDFDSSGGRVMKLTALGYRNLLFEVRGKCKYMHEDIRNILR